MKRLVPIIVVCLVALALSAAGAQAGRFVSFQTPDKNIACVIFKGEKHGKHGGVRCDIGQHTWVAPPAPKSCAYDYGQGAILGRRGLGKYSCVSDSALGIGPLLPAGTAASKGRYTCTATQATLTGNGVHCVNRFNQHGFDLSQPAISFF